MKDLIIGVVVIVLAVAGYKHYEGSPRGPMAKAVERVSDVASSVVEVSKDAAEAVADKSIEVVDDTKRALR